MLDALLLVGATLAWALPFWPLLRARQRSTGGHTHVDLGPDSRPPLDDGQYVVRTPRAPALAGPVLVAAAISAPLLARWATGRFSLALALGSCALLGLGVWLWRSALGDERVVCFDTRAREARFAGDFSARQPIPFSSIERVRIEKAIQTVDTPEGSGEGIAYAVSLVTRDGSWAVLHSGDGTRASRTADAICILTGAPLESRTDDRRGEN